MHVIGVSVIHFLFQILKISTMMTICHDAEIFELKLKHVIGFCIGHYIPEKLKPDNCSDDLDIKMNNFEDPCFTS